MKTEILSQKIEALRIELAKAKATEKAAARAAADRKIRRAISESGLLAMVHSGAIGFEQLASEFRAVAGRTGKAAEPTTTVTEPEPKKGLWGRP